MKILTNQQIKKIRESIRRWHEVSDYTPAMEAIEGIADTILTAVRPRTPWNSVRVPLLGKDRAAVYIDSPAGWFLLILPIELSGDCELRWDLRGEGDVVELGEAVVADLVEAGIISETYVPS